MPDRVNRRYRATGHNTIIIPYVETMNIFIGPAGHFEMMVTVPANDQDHALEAPRERPAQEQAARDRPAQQQAPRERPARQQSPRERPTQEDPPAKRIKSGEVENETEEAFDSVNSGIIMPAGVVTSSGAVETTETPRATFVSQSSPSIKREAPAGLDGITATKTSTPTRQTRSQTARAASMTSNDGAKDEGSEHTLDKLISAARLARQETDGCHVVVAKVPKVCGRQKKEPRVVVTAGSSTGGPPSYIVRGRDLDGNVVLNGVGPFNRTSYKGVTESGGYFLGRFVGLTEEEIEKVISAVAEHPQISVEGGSIPSEDIPHGQNSPRRR